MLFIPSLFLSAHRINETKQNDPKCILRDISRHSQKIIEVMSIFMCFVFDNELNDAAERAHSVEFSSQRNASKAKIFGFLVERGTNDLNHLSSIAVQGGWRHFRKSSLLYKYVTENHKSNFSTHLYFRVPTNWKRYTDFLETKLWWEHFFLASSAVTNAGRALYIVLFQLLLLLLLCMCCGSTHSSVFCHHYYIIIIISFFPLSTIRLLSSPSLVFSFILLTRCARAANSCILYFVNLSHAKIPYLCFLCRRRCFSNFEKVPFFHFILFGTYELSCLFAIWVCIMCCSIGKPAKYLTAASPSQNVKLSTIAT